MLLPRLTLALLQVTDFARHAARCRLAYLGMGEVAYLQYYSLYAQLSIVEKSYRCIKGIKSARYYQERNEVWRGEPHPCIFSTKLA